MHYGWSSSGTKGLQKTSLFHQRLWQMCCTGVCILVMTVVFVLLKSSGISLQGACEMTVTISAESPPSLYQFFVLKCPERPVECPTSGISKQILLVCSQYSWHCGKTCSKRIRGHFHLFTVAKGSYFDYEKMCLCGARTSL